MTSLFTLDIRHFRNIQSCSLDRLSTFNIFYGENGAGKTSVLESISLLCQGKSFRTNAARSLIQHDFQDLVVFSSTDSGRRFGHRRTKDGFELKVDGEVCKSLSTIAQELPVSLLDNNSSDLLVGSPSIRRAFVDWLMFHVEQQSFHSVWLRYKKLLKQRNELLKRANVSPKELVVWDKSLVETGEILAQSRRAAMKDISEAVNSLYQSFGFDFGELTIEFSDGWKQGEDLSTALFDNRERDIRYKTTHAGPHRFDIKILIDGIKASELLSRGQIKSMSQLMILANAILLCQKRPQNLPILLIDDFGAELDKHNRGKLLRLISRYNMQVFVSCIDKNEVLSYLPDELVPTMFHVEQGKIVNEKKI